MAAVALVACGGGRTEDLPVESAAGGGGSRPVDVAPLGPAERLDVVFVVDDGLSASLGHPSVAGSLPYFIDRLTTPRCTNGFGRIVDNPGPGAPCEVGRRDFAPVADVHVAVLSSSLGSPADTCAGPTPNPADDRARPLTANLAGGVVPTYQDLGFLAWDPNQVADPPGEGDQEALASALRDVVLGAGGDGCAFPAPLEAVRRFLVDPAPPLELVREGEVTVPRGVDEELLALRDAFLRPDSAVLVVVVTDRDDCSLAYGPEAPGAYRVAQTLGGDGEPARMRRAREECVADPDDPCCAPCGEAGPSCPPSPLCSASPTLSAAEDPLSLRCFEPARRFGRDDRFPLERYRAALSETTITTAQGEVDNPLFVGGRRRERVLFAAVTGVPWQDLAIARTSPAEGLVPATEAPWELLLATPEGPAQDPLMVPSLTPRTGENPVTGDALAPPEAPSPSANPINGHEHALADRPQYSCIYPLPTALSCGAGDCECVAGAIQTNPVCQTDEGPYAPTQRFGRATPAPRLLRLTRELGLQGILGTVCTAPVTTASSPAFGIKPSIDAVIRRLVPVLVPPAEP